MQRTWQEKMKRDDMTKYEKIKARVLVFIAATILTQAVVSAGSFVITLMHLPPC